MNRRIQVLFAAPVLVAIILAGDLAASDEVVLHYKRDIRPLLARKCGKCHEGPQGKGELDLLSLGGMARGGESGEPAVAGSLDESMLWTMVDGGDMPPKGEPPLTASERETIRRWIASTALAEVESADRVTQHDVLPYLYTRGVVCHGGRRKEGGLDLRSVESILKGGKSGPAVVPGKPNQSLLLKRVLAKDMPPPRELIRAGVRPLETPEIELITKWVVQGARHFDIQPDAPSAQPDRLVTDDDRKFWAFQPPLKPAVPTVKGQVAGTRPIDSFLRRALQSQQLDFAPEAPRATLVRRVAFDLTGLPPRWVELQRFVNDPSRDWYEQMVDHYLQSPRYGERWGRYWLDLSGYADSEGKRSADPIRAHAWRYRDYVIRALNEDKPYNQFLVEQLAGDELHDYQNADPVTPEMMDALVATGFLRMAPDGTGSDIVDTVEERFEVVADEIEVLGSSVLGLTLRCAQCHSHKYDPIPQRDYYRLVAVFQGAYDVYDWLKPTSVANQSKQKNPTRRFLKYVSVDERQRWLEQQQPLQDQIDDGRRRQTERTAELRAKLLDERLGKVPEQDQAAVRDLVNVDEDDRTDEQRALAKRFDDVLKITAKQLPKRFPELTKERAAWAKQEKALRAKMPPEPMIRALWDRGEPSPTWVFLRGQFATPGAMVGPGVPSVLTDGRTPFVPQSKRAGSTGRRLAMAQWLTDPRHPLTARVLVNRVWFHHFGRGIVPTLANFGQTGERPSHPELLDWLAVCFVEQGWSLKWLHREILTSRAYRQSSQLRGDSVERDSDNRWLSRMPMRRLEAEAVRDSLLAVAGELDERPFGPPDDVTVRSDGLVTSKRGENGWRRTVYVRQRRKELPTILETFDLPQMIPNCVTRPDSTVASQALHLLNNQMVRELSERFANRVAKQCPNDQVGQIERVYQIALGRVPSPAEQKLAQETLEQLTTHWRKQTAKPTKSGGQPDAELRALANLCHVIINSAEFLFVD